MLGDCWPPLSFLLFFFLVIRTEGCPASCDCDEQTADCARRGLTVVPTDLPAGIKRLDLSDNSLSHLPNDTFASIPALKFLDLRKNKFDGISPAVDRFDSLQRLDLRANAISALTAEDVVRLARVEHVDLTRNRISVWPSLSAPPDTTRLLRLDLGNNLLNELAADQFAALSQLQTVRLAKNRLVDLPPDVFRGLNQLKNLDLSRNRFRLLRPLTFSSLSSLEVLNLARNQLNVQPAAFHGLDALRSLNLSANRIDSTGIADGGLYGLNRLEELDLSNNLLAAIPAQSWNYVPELKRLWLNGNQLRRLAAGGFPLGKLEFLSLASNQLNAMQADSLRGLKSDLSENDLASCVEDRSVWRNFSLPSLRTLSFASNQLRLLPAHSFAQFPNLRSLDLRDNPIITVFADAFGQLERISMNTHSLLCDCKLLWFRRWLNGTTAASEETIATCGSPPRVAGDNLHDVAVDELTCDTDSPLVRLVQFPQSLLKILVGDRAHLSCSGFGRAPLKLSWRAVRNGVVQPVESSEAGGLRTVVRHSKDERNPQSGNEHVHGELHFVDARPEHKADYQCVIENTFGSAYSDLSTVSVQRLPAFVARPVDQAALVGQNVLLTCAADGDPPPRRLHIREEDDGVYLLNVSMRDAGKYACTATSDAGRIAHTAELLVYERAFKKPLTTRVFTGETPVFFDCSTPVRPPFHVRWLWNGSVPLNETGRRVITKAAGQVLLIPETTHLTNGTVTCELYVNGGQFLSSQTADLVVRRSGLSAELEAKAARQPRVRPPARSTTRGPSRRPSGRPEAVWFVLIGAGLTFVLFGLLLAAVCCWRRRRTARRRRKEDSGSNESERPLKSTHSAISH
ncbi:Immunoglobulin I-set domain containing protein [Aphelenchoides fujianensis]|nr:Immunoglobulin I-set domain containing protein [Aphelenchoides fujianensis]